MTSSKPFSAEELAEMTAGSHAVAWELPRATARFLATLAARDTELAALRIAHDVASAQGATTNVRVEPAPVPIPMFLTCPACAHRHIDEGEFATKVHHTHSCQNCGLTWRPAIVPTVGVAFLPGFKNADPPKQERCKAGYRGTYVGVERCNLSRHGDAQRHDSENYAWLDVHEGHILDVTALPEAERIPDVEAEAKKTSEGGAVTPSASSTPAGAPQEPASTPPVGKHWCNRCRDYVAISEQRCCTGCGGDDLTYSFQPLPTPPVEEAALPADCGATHTYYDSCCKKHEACTWTGGIATLEATVRNLLASAVPNERDHPTMWKAWESARAVLSPEPEKP